MSGDGDQPSFFNRFKNITALGTANIVANGISALFWIYLATLLGKEGYGELGYLLAIAGTASGFASLGSINTLVVYRSKGVEIQATVFFLVIVVSAITALTLFFIIDNVIVSIYPVGYVIFSLTIYELLGKKFYLKYSKYMITQRILMVALALIFYHVLGINGIILGYTLSYLAYSFPIYRGFRESKIDFSLVRTRFGFMMNNYVTHVVKILSGNIDRLIIFPTFGAAILGTYQLGFQIYVLSMLLPNIVFQYVLPQDAAGAPNKKLKKYTVAASCILTVLTIMISPYVIPFFFEEFADTVEVAQIMSLALIPSTLSLIYNSEFLAVEKSKSVLISSGSATIALVIGILLLGERFDVIGMAFAVVIAKSAEFILLHMIKRHNNHKLKLA
jgi:O-antigen/teichoic acid export membrane protein